MLLFRKPYIHMFTMCQDFYTLGEELYFTRMRVMNIYNSQGNQYWG